MKIFVKPIIVGLLILMSFACKKESPKIIISADELCDSINTVVFMHPTVNNIKTVKYLTENKILPVSNNTRFIGVYHSNATYNYNQSKDYILKNGIDNIRLLPIVHKLNADAIYKNNDCSIDFEKIFNGSKAIIFFGGPDMPPACYGDSTSLLTVITDPNRHYLELSFLYHLLGGYQDSAFNPLLKQNPKYTILGICLGMQSINVATGGKLYQDIPTELYGLRTVESVLAAEANAQHRNYYNNFATDTGLIWGSFHQVNFVEEPFKTMVTSNTSPFVLSSHHQCIKRVGKDLKVAAYSMDGKIIEAITHTKFPNVLGVQFHPEPPILYKKDEPVWLIPNQTSTASYIDLYGGDAGENFHRNFCLYFGKLLE